MKNLFIVIFFLLMCYNVVAQVRKPSGTPTQSSTGWFKQGYQMSDSGTIIANRDTNWLAKYSGTIVFKPSNRKFYWFDSTLLRWNLLNGRLDTAYNGLSLENNGVILGGTLDRFTDIDNGGNEFFLHGTAGNSIRTQNGVVVNQVSTSLIGSALQSSNSSNNLFSEVNAVVGSAYLAGGRNGRFYNQVNADTNSVFLVTKVNVSPKKLILDTLGYVTLDAYPSLTQETDTTTFKPMGINSSGKMVPMAFWRTGSGSPGVTSVALSMPSAFSVSGSPITGSGTFNVTGAGTSLQYIRGNGALATTDTGMIPNFHLKVRSLITGSSPITFNQTSGIIGINNANTTGTKGAATFTSAFADNGSGLIDLPDLVSSSSCTNCNITFDSKGRATAYSNGSGGGGSIVNAGGSGDTLLNGSAIKRLDHDATIINTPSANNIVQGVDTFVTVATKWELKDTSFVLRTVINEKIDTTGFLGIKYANNSWTTLSDFNNINVTASISGNRILLSPTSPGSVSQTLNIKGPSCLEFWTQTIHYTFNDAPGVTTYGTGIGLASTNSHVTSSVVAYVDHSTDAGNNGHLFISGTYPSVAALASSTGTIPHSNGDKIEIILERQKNTITATARNLTTNSSEITATYTYNTTTVGQPLLPNTGEFAMFAIGGQVYIDSVAVFSKEAKRAQVAFNGDSKMVSYYTAYSKSAANLTRNSIENVVINAGGGDRPQDVYSRLEETYTLNPHQYILEIGTNESDSNVVKDYIIKINDSLFAHGIPCYHTVFYQSSSDAGWRFNFIKRTFQPQYIINTYDILQQPNTLAADGFHLTEFGNSVIAYAFLTSDKLHLGRSFSSVGGDFINNGTSLQPSASFNIDGPGQSAGWVTSPSGSNAVFKLFNNSGNANDAVAVLYPTDGTNQSMNLYISPKGDGSGGNYSSIGVFNKDYVADPSNFGFASLQIKGTECDFYTDHIGSGTLVPLKIFTGGNTQLQLNTDGTNSFTGNTFFFNQVGIGPAFTTPFSKALLHSSHSVNDAVYNMVSNANTGVAASAGVKATLNPATDTTDYIAIQVVGPNFVDVRRPIAGGKSAFVESASGANMYISNYSDTGSIVFTTKKTMQERARIDSTGKVTFGVLSNSYTFPTTRASSGQVLTDVAGNGVLSWQTVSGATTIYNGNGVVSGPRLVDVNGNTVTFRGTNNSDTIMAIINDGTSSTGLYSYGAQYGVDAQSGNIGLRAFGTGAGITTTGSSSEGIIAQSNSIRAGKFISSVSSTNSVQELIRLDRATTGTAANGIGGSIELWAEDASATSTLANELIWKWTDVTNGSQTSQFSITTKNAGSPLTVATWDGDGTFTTVGKRIIGVTTSSSGTLTIGNSEAYIFNGTTTTWTLPAVSGTTGYKYYLKNIGSGAITLNANAGANEIYTSSAVNTTSIAAGSAIILISNGTYWTVN